MQSKIFNLQSKMNKGITLIEFLLYIGIAATIVLALTAVLLNVFSGKAKTSAMEETVNNARFVLEKVTEKVRNAESINSPAQGVASSTLSLEVDDSSKDPAIFDLSSGVARLKEGTGSYINLTTAKVTVIDLEFTNVSYSNTPGTVRIKITVEYNNPSGRKEYEYSKTFYTTVNIREKP